MVRSLLYSLTRNTLGTMAASPRGYGQGIEIVVLRHQLTSGANIPRHQPRPSSCSTATRLLPAVGAGHGGVSTCRWPSQARLAHDAQGLRSVHVVFSGQVATQLAAWRRVELGS
jgi:hypothetical protein